jgi:hypothetical protein
MESAQAIFGTSDLLGRMNILKKNPICQVITPLTPISGDYAVPKVTNL